VRTWAPRGQTPVLQHHFNWNQLSAIAGITLWTFYFRLYPGTIRTPQVIDFLLHLRRQIPGKLLVIWDGLAAHRSGILKDFIADLGGEIVLERLPGYAPELNPVEFIWAHWKQHELANFCPADFAKLSLHARHALRRMRRRPRLIRAFWKQAELF
jgi:transposase